MPARHWVALGILVSAAVVKWIASLRKWRLMPPGPRGIPILGNALQMPSEQAWLRFTEWKEQYGPMYSLNLAGQPVIILNNHKTVNDLFDRRSSIYSDRPRLIVAGEYLTGGIFMVFARYGNVWRKMRRAAHEGFNIRTCTKYQSTQETDGAHLVLEMNENPDQWIDHLKLSTASNILTAVYGWDRITPKDKSVITRIHAHTARIAGAVVPGAFLVEIFPFLDFVPRWLSKSKRESLQWHQKDTKMFLDLNKGVNEKKESFVRDIEAPDAGSGLTKEENAWLAGIMFSAGAETTLGTITNFVLAMTLYPGVMHKAQAEIDRVVGRDRLPSFSDRPNLPFVRAMIKETLRWRPVGPLAVPRRATQDDYYEGYLIPKGTTVIPNIWAINRDPEFFPDFDEYRPERFLDESGTRDFTPPEIESATHGMGHTTFGFGRRICVGYNFANQVLFMQMATLLWAFNFKKPVDENGNPITPSKSACIDAGVVVLPAPFKTHIEIRSPNVLSVAQNKLDHSETVSS